MNRRHLTLSRLHLGLILSLGLAAAMTPALTPAIAGEKAARIITLGGSVTEIAVALGAGDRLIARDTTSNHPDSIRSLPDVGYIRALSPEGVLALGPDMILSEDGAGPPEAVEVLKAAGIPFVTAPNDPSPDGITAKIAAVAAALDLPEAGKALSDEVQQGLAAATARAAAVTAPKRVLFLLSVQDGRVMAGGEGSSAAAIIALSGGVNAGTGFSGFKPITDEAILTAAPDVILMMDREGDLAIADDDILSHPALSQTPAGRDKAILRMDGMLLLGFGPRTPAAAQALFDALYPQG